ncbi:hypothetical protein E7703_14150 [Citrobacter portucalensis]|uniref:hypothetical protein n=1 Tax=Citrobacter portucalensis TaxID=1639133 RepID=UPI0010A5202B|nr:hypothetical protein [Citrobacter portucalensis]QCD02232.1 hypothetical protein E7703_14150 [Citrobacter portucalensis]
MKIWEEQVKNTVYHELGHWIASKQLGYQCQGIKLVLGDDGNRYYLTEANVHTLYHPSLRTFDDILKYLSERAVIGLSGVSCQSILLDVDMGKAIKEYGSGDFEKAQELSLIYRGVQYPEDQSEETENKQRGEFMMNAFIKSREIIINNKHRIISMSESIISMIAIDKITYEINVTQLNELYSRVN